MLDPASGARMGRPCYLVISAIENRVTGVTGAPRFPHVSTNAKRSSLLRRPTSRFARLLEALPVLTGENVIRTSHERPADDSSEFVMALSPDERRDLNEVNDAVSRTATPGGRGTATPGGRYGDSLK